MSSLLLLIATQLAWGGSLAEGRACLHRLDVPCATAISAEIKAAESSKPLPLAFAADTAFYAGDFETAFELQGKANVAGFNDRWDNLGLFERTMAVTQDWTASSHDGFEVHYAPGVDALLLDDAHDTLQRARANLAPLLGGPVPGPTRLEIFPTGKDFTDASSLPPEAVARTGVVALSKWSRLLIMSPRVLPRGYGWRDTVAHEYIHLVVAYHSNDSAPVWLQEAIAKYLDNRWEDGKDHFQLTVRQQGLLAEAIVNDNLVTVEEIGYSFATMSSADRSSLAYAQSSSQMSYAFERGGEDILISLLPKLASGTDPHVALARAASYDSWSDFEAAWLAWVKQQDLVSKRIAQIPTLVGGGDDIAADPVLAQRADLARYVRLGDLLRQHERYEASLVEYNKALPEDGTPSSPLLSNRMAQTHLALLDLAAAEALLLESLKTYPEFPLSWKTLGAIHAEQGRFNEAIEAYKKACDFNPFDREVQTALASLARNAGQIPLAEKHDKAVTILKRGGEG